ncbi:hypothetical protein AHF37_10889 [Paragonimus kellicotti]|nr:hypothetical protein AHF37_10889 [Paragonimus kellicotti]
MDSARLRSAHQELSNVVHSLNPFYRINFTLLVCSVLKKTREFHGKKLQLLISKEDMISSFAPNLDHYVRNLSARSLNRTEMEALSVGLRFCIPPFNISDIHVETQFELLYDQVKTLEPTSNDAAGWFKVKLVDLAHQYLAYANQAKLPVE